MVMNLQEIRFAEILGILRCDLRIRKIENLANL